MNKRYNRLRLILALAAVAAVSQHESIAGVTSDPRPSGREIRKEIVVDAPVADVWSAWTTVEGLTSFFAPRARMELRVGGPFEILFDSTAPAGLQGSEGCVVLGFEPGKLLSFSWNAPPKFPNVRKERTRVDLHFEAVDASRTKVTLVETGWGEGDEWDQVYQYFNVAWGYVMGAFKERFAASQNKGGEKTMEPRLVQVKPFSVAGISVRTSNRDEGDPDRAKLGIFWGRFFSEEIASKVPNSAPDAPIYGVYSAYESDVNGYYTTTAGVRLQPGTEVKGELTVVEIKGGDYLVFELEGPMLAAWEKVWSYFEGSSEYVRAYTTDFEEYRGEEQVAIHIAVRKR